MAYDLSVFRGAGGGRGGAGYRVGLPAKSGIGGGIVTASPGKGALGTFSPRLDATGNSVRGTLATAALARRLGLDLFSTPDT